MRTVVIGGSGHIGTYLVPELVAAGHEVINPRYTSLQAVEESLQWLIDHDEVKL